MKGRSGHLVDSSTVNGQYPTLWDVFHCILRTIYNINCWRVSSINRSRKQESKLWLKCTLNFAVWWRLRVCRNWGSICTAQAGLTWANLIASWRLIIDRFKREFITNLWICTCRYTVYSEMWCIYSSMIPSPGICWFHLLPKWNQTTVTYFTDFSTKTLWISQPLSFIFEINKKSSIQNSKDKSRSLFLSLGEALSVRSSAWLSGSIKLWIGGSWYHALKSPRPPKVRVIFQAGTLFVRWFQILNNMN